jgi:hypothetical protein
MACCFAWFLIALHILLNKASSKCAKNRTRAPRGTASERVFYVVCNFGSACHAFFADFS